MRFQRAKKDTAEAASSSAIIPGIAWTRTQSPHFNRTTLSAGPVGS